MDPGTTTGIAIFDLTGRLLGLQSSKGVSRSAISAAALEKGMPVIVATDKSPAPRTVERIASGFSAKVHVPDKGMDWRRKRDLAKDFTSSQAWPAKPGQENGRKAWKNSHEKDALLAGWHAWKCVRQLVEKVERKVGNGERGDFVKAQVLANGMKISDSANLFENISKGANTFA